MSGGRVPRLREDVDILASFSSVSFCRVEYGAELVELRDDSIPDAETDKDVC